ncbi:hypothetical protein HPP92_000666 [Vanilla planifolia]|uniref:Uncharacterized protein n=1 Tax=Vanilla planifolia TaxID=51239 RepID=A0A835RWV1_VANPL|nr:hypothetical protein HPP92_000666 [Vanilla planifolia]
MAASVVSCIALRCYRYAAPTLYPRFMSTQTWTLLCPIWHHNLPRISQNHCLLAANAGPRPSPPNSSSGKSPNFLNGVQAMLSRTEDRIRIFFAVLFWLSLFFWGSAWNGRDGDEKKGRRIKK